MTSVLLRDCNMAAASCSLVFCSASAMFVCVSQIFVSREGRCLCIDNNLFYKNYRNAFSATLYANMSTTTQPTDIHYLYNIFIITVNKTNQTIIIILKTQNAYTSFNIHKIKCYLPLLYASQRYYQ